MQRLVQVLVAPFLQVIPEKLLEVHHVTGICLVLFQQFVKFDKKWKNCAASAK